MEAKLLILVVLVAGSVVAYTEGRKEHIGHPPTGRKREVRLSVGF